MDVFRDLACLENENAKMIVWWFLCSTNLSGGGGFEMGHLLRVEGEGHCMS